MRTISELSAEANSYEFTSRISFASWLHVSRTLLRESQVYDAEGTDPERAFILYLRYADLVLNKLRKHPGLNASKPAYNKAVSQVSLAIQRSEALKKRLEAQKPEHNKPIPKHPGHSRPSNHTVRASTEENLEKELEKYASDTIEVPDIDLNSLIIKDVQPVKFTSISCNQTPFKVPEYPSLQPSRHPQPHPQPRPPPEAPPEAPLEQSSPSLEFKSIFTTEKGDPLRTVFVPSQLRSRFLEIALPNTRNNLETCGMLCGKLRRNAFFVTDLVIPKQTSTSDSCATTNEEELFEYVDSRDLFILGWIHTHPTQTCFMSSVDLHTHASYQLMLPEAVAIVCAPTSSPSWGAFRLTDPPGIDVIKTCKLSGFHQHTPNDNLYRSARLQGHYKETQFDLVTEDLRNGTA